MEHVLCGSPGRPAFSIPRQVLERFVENKFNVSAMEFVLKVSESAVKRILCNYDISVHSQYPNLSKADLDAMVMKKRERKETLFKFLVVLALEH